MFNSINSFNVLYTTNVEKTAMFFTKIGVAITAQTNEKVVVTIGTFELHYIHNESEPFEAYTYIAEPVYYGQGIIFYIETTDINQIEQIMSSTDGTLKSSIFENKWGGKEILVEDPNGYKFAFYQMIQ